MKLNKRQVAITGVGIVSCLGNDVDTVQTSLREMRSGIKLLPERKKIGMRSALSGVIDDFDPSNISRKQRKTLPEFGLWAWDALCQALDDAGLDKSSLLGSTSAGIIMGNDSSAVTAVEQVEILRAEGSSHLIGSGHIFRLLNSTLSLNFSVNLGLKGYCWTVSSACASGAMAIGQAFELISSGRQDTMICGGAQEISWESMCSFDAIGAFSAKEDSPSEASRPFDIHRDGLVPSGGAAIIVLEDMEKAVLRGAEVIGEIAGYGTCSDGFNIILPDGDGLERAIGQAMDQASVTPNDIDLVLAHATSTDAGDRAEAKALGKIFNNGVSSKRPVVTAVKGLTGHEFWMAGASSVVYGLLMARGGFVAGNLNLTVPDPEASGLFLPRSSFETPVSTILCNSSGFGGANAVLLVKAFEG